MRQKKMKERRKKKLARNLQLFCWFYFIPCMFVRSFFSQHSIHYPHLTLVFPLLIFYTSFSFIEIEKENNWKERETSEGKSVRVFLHITIAWNRIAMEWESVFASAKNDGSGSSDDNDDVLQVENIKASHSTILFQTNNHFLSNIRYQ